MSTTPENPETPDETQVPDENVERALRVGLDERCLRRAREEAARLQQEEPRGDRRELRKNGRIAIGLRLDIGHELIGDRGQRDRGDIQFFALDQAQQHLQRSLESGEAVGVTKLDDLHPAHDRGRAHRSPRPSL